MPFIENPQGLQRVAFQVAYNALHIKTHMLLNEAGLELEKLSYTQQVGLIEKLQVWLDQKWPGLYDVAFEDKGLFLYQCASEVKNLGYNRVATTQHPSLATSSLTFGGKVFRNSLEFPVYAKDSPESAPVEVGNGVLMFPSFIRPKIIAS